ncbi:MAG: hypothetical protein HQ568_05170 [Calditrichaeota bacterium]|nr:hypothetical protein [Calditrichota bacterium]
MEVDIFEKKQLANKLRKAKKYSDAIAIYEPLWEVSDDPYIGVGYLACLRKLKQFQKAIPLAAELWQKFPELDWCKVEVAWTKVQGELLPISENENLQKVIDKAKSILEMKPDHLARKFTILRVLKCSTAKKDWDCAKEWIDLLDPKNLSDNPMDIHGRKGWSDQEIWYNYKIKCLLKQNDPQSALNLCNSLEGKFLKNAMYFSRLKALSYKLLGKIDSALETYKAICDTPRPPSWLLHEYGKLIRDSNKDKEALVEFCRAAIFGQSLPHMIKLFSDIGNLFVKLGESCLAVYHYQLTKLIRLDNDWSIPANLEIDIKRIAKEQSLSLPSDIKSCLRKCREYWEKESGAIPSNKQIKKNLRGRISIISDRNICFVNTKDGLSAICFKDRIPSTISNGDIVEFDVKPSFDKKKNRDSWRAVKLRKP